MRSFLEKGGNNVDITNNIQPLKFKIKRRHKRYEHSQSTHSYHTHIQRPIKTVMKFAPTKKNHNSILSNLINK
jgi:hypothetical protein